MGVKQFGWVEQGLIFNSLSPTNRWNGPVYTDDRSNEYEMNQLWLGWERPVKTDGCGWDIGGRVDLMYGTDWRYGLCNGLETNIDAPNHLYGLIMPQFFLEVGYNDLTVKLGHFAPSIGYEVVAAPGNFFYSHSYALGYSEPVLVTGFQADYKLNESWNVIGGLNEGFNQFQDENGKFHFLGGLKWHNDEHKVSVSLMTDVGPQVTPVDPLGKDDQYEFTLVLKKQLSEKLLYAFEQTFGARTKLPPARSAITPSGTAWTSTCCTRSIPAGRRGPAWSSSATRTGRGWAGWAAWASRAGRRTRDSRARSRKSRWD